MFKPHKDLDIAYHNTDNTLQSTWIKMLNEKKTKHNHWCLLQALKKNIQITRFLKI